MLRGALLRATRAASARRLPAVLGRSVTTRATGPASACTLSRQLAQPHGTTTLWRFSAVRAFCSDAVVEVPVPALGDSIAEGTVAGILKDVGEWVDMDEVVLTLETDKVSFDVRAPEAGYVEELLIEDGDTVPVGAVLLKLKKGDPPAGAEKKAEAPKAADDSSSSSSSAAAEAPPAAKEAPKAAAPKAATPPPPPPAPVTAGSRTEERVKMSPMRKRIAERLKDSQNTAAMLTTFQEVDMGTLIDLRKRYKEDFAEKHGVKLGFMSAFIKASAAALMEIPAVNAVIDGTDIVYRNYVDVSVAVASPRGLVVPVIRNVQDMNFAGIELTLGELAHKARTGSIALEDMAGGTFTISNGGVFGSLMGTPILNLPQSAILGMHATKPRPVVVNGEVVIRPMMYLALTYDHRLIDGREAVTFLCSVRDKIEDPSRLLLEL